MSGQDHDRAQSFFVASSDEADLRLHIRSRGAEPARPPLLFVHGATYASRIYDIPHPGYNWLAAAAEEGFAAYALDIRGYGKSRSPALEKTNEPYATASAAVRDIGDAVEWICARHGTAQVGLVGGSWGTVTTALYASGPGQARVSALVLSAPLFAERNPLWLKILADPADPARFNPLYGAYRWIDLAQTRVRWDEEIPPGEIAAWREEAVLRVLFDTSLADDPEGARQDPPAFRAPNGTFLDLWEVFNGRPLYDPAALTCPLLLLRGSHDLTATRSDALALFDAAATKTKHYHEIANAAHFSFAERKAPEVFAASLMFLQQVLSAQQ